MQLVEQGFEFVIGNQAIRRRGNSSRRGSDRCSRRRNCRQRIGSKRALAMQLIEQRFKFVVGDIGAGRWRSRLHRRRCGCHGVRGELALAVQLVEQ